MRYRLAFLALLLTLCLLLAQMPVMAEELPTPGALTDSPTEEPTPPPTEEPTPPPTQEPTPPPTEEPTPDPTPDYEYDPLKLSASANPKTVPGPGPVQVTVTVLNDGDSPVDTITIKDEGGNTLHTINGLSEGDTSSPTLSVDVTQSMLDRGYIEFTVTWSLPAGSGKKTVRASIGLLEANPKIEFERSASPKIADQGQEVVISYTVRNTGNVPLIGIEIKDELMGGGAITVDRLDVGSKTTKQYKFTMGSANAVSKPSLKYRTEESETNLTKTLDSLTIQLAEKDLIVELAADKTSVDPGSEVLLMITLTNNGNVEYNNISITDQSNLIEIPNTNAEPLRPGKSQMYTARVLVNESTTYAFTVTARDTTTKEDVPHQSNSLTIEVSSQVLLQITARLEAELTGPGTAAVLITLQNDSEQQLNNVVLYERTEGQLVSYTTLPVGPTNLREEFPVAEPTTLSFYAAVGNLQVEGPTVDIAFGTPVSLPPSAEEETPVTEEDGSWMTILLTVVGIVAFLIIAVIVALVIMGIRDRRAQEALYDDEENSPRKEGYRARDDEMDNTRRIDTHKIRTFEDEDDRYEVIQEGTDFDEDDPLAYNDQVFRRPDSPDTIKVREDDLYDDEDIDYDDIDFDEDIDYDEEDDGGERPMSRAERRARRKKRGL